MEPALAAKHPDIKTYRGRGIDDPAATIRADLTPLGFHASVRSRTGTWYIDPYYHLDQSLYASYYGRDLKDTSGAPFVERDAQGGRALGRPRLLPRRRLGDRVRQRLRRGRRRPDHHLRPRRALRLPRGDRPYGRLGRRSRPASSPTRTAISTRTSSRRPTGPPRRSASYQVVRDDDPTSDPPTGDVLRTYRLALITDPGYATFFGGSANVTAAKVTLINRVSHVYEDDLSIRMVLIGNNDLLNLDTWGAAIGPQRPVRRGGLLHAVAGDRLLEHEPGAVRDRPDHRRVQLRHRPPRARPAGRRRGQPRRRRALEQGRRLHGHPDACRRLLRHRLRRPRDGPPVQRQPPVQWKPAQLLWRQPERGHLGRGRQRLLDHGLRRHLPDRRPPAAQRPVLLGAQPPGDLDLHVERAGSHQRGPDRLAPPLRRRQRSSGGHLRAGLPGTQHHPAAVRRDRRCSERHPARRGLRRRQHRHHLDRRGRRRAHAPGRRRSDDRRGRRGRLQRDVHRHRGPHLPRLPGHQPGLRAGEVRWRHGHAQCPRPERGRHHRDRPDVPCA